MHAAPVVADHSDAAGGAGVCSPPPVTPHHRYRQQQRTRNGEGKQQPSTEEGEESTAVVQDSRSYSSSCRLYHRLATRPLQEIKLPSEKQVGE